MIGIQSKLGLIVTGIVAFSGPVWASGSSYAPTSFELVYEPTYSLASGGPTSQLGSLGGGIRIGYAMTKMIGFELGGYYDNYVFGAVAGANQSAYAARGTMDFMVAPTQGTRFYAGIDANAFFTQPSALAPTNNKDLGVIGGFRVITPGALKLFVGAEYRYAVSPVFTYAGGSITNAAVIGTAGIHFGGL